MERMGIIIDGIARTEMLPRGAAMSELVPTPANSLPDTAPKALHAELRVLIASSRQRLAGAVNAELTRLYWNVG